MRIYYVSSGLQGCYFVRCLQPLMANGWDGDQTSLTQASNTPENKAAAASDADVVVFHRPDDPKKLEAARILRKMGKKIVFDNDDTVKDDGGFKFNTVVEAERFKKGMERMDTSIDNFIKEADLVTCSTEFLKEEYQKLNPNVVVVPNCVDPFYFDEPLRNETDVVRIGIVGSIAVTADMKVAIPIIKALEGIKDVRVVLFSLPPAKHDKVTRKLYKEEYEFFDSVDVEWQPFVNMEDYARVLNELRLDIAIIPRADNYFNRCKSNLKFLEMSMLEIPVIAQGFPDGKSPYETDTEDAEHMIIIKDNKDWVPEIEKLAKDKARRREMGTKAREYVINKYDIEKNADRWVKAYETLFTKN
jgi:glycosyltransferase involved in cell wall biosynthesis